MFGVGRLMGPGSGLPTLVFGQQGNKLVGSGNTGQSTQTSVALSSDGNTLALGGYSDNGGKGAIWVFTRTNGVWSQQGSKLTGSGETGNGLLGVAVSLSADGNTLLAGAISDNSVGASFVYTRAGDGTWSQQQRLFGTGGSGVAHQGNGVALSADGNTAVIGAPNDTANAGCLYIWTRSGGTWTQRARLTATGAVGAARVGQTVAINAAGTVVAAGAFTDNTNVGAAWVFTGSGASWSQQAKLIGSGGVAPSNQGRGLALSGDGSTLVVGGDPDNSSVGAVWVFRWNGSGWSQVGSKLVGTGASGAASQGLGLAINSSGSIIAVGGFTDNSNAGALWVYQRNPFGLYVQQGSKLTGTGETGASQMASSVAVSSDGSTIAAGGGADNTNVGAAWIFSRLRNPP